MENFGDIQNVCLKVFESIARTTSVFVLPLFLTRIVFSNVLGEGSKVLTHLKGVVIYFCLIAGFPIIMEILFSIPDAFLPQYNSASGLAGAVPVLGDPSVIPFGLDRIIEVLLAGLYWIVYYLHVFFMLLMCSMAPIVFLTSTLLGMGLGIEIFLGLLIVGSSWPIIWYGFDQVHLSLMSAQADGFGSKCLELLLTVCKGIAPVAFASIAIKSPAGKIASGAAKLGIAAGKWTVATAPAAGSKFGPAPGKSGSTNLTNQFFKNQGQGSGARSFAKNRPTNAADRLSLAKKQAPAEKEEKPNENPRPRDI